MQYLKKQNMENMEGGAIYCGMPSSIGETSDTHADAEQLNKQ